MKNPPLTLLRYWSRCQKGLPVYFAKHSGGELCLRLGSTLASSSAGLLMYARLNQPTGRLLVHFIRTETLGNHALLRGDVLHIPAKSTLGPVLAQLLALPTAHYYLRPGRYPLLTDERFFTASVEITPKQRSSPPTIRQEQRAEYAL